MDKAKLEEIRTNFWRESREGKDYLTLHDKYALGVLSMEDREYILKEKKSAIDKKDIKAIIITLVIILLIVWFVSSADWSKAKMPRTIAIPQANTSSQTPGVQITNSTQAITSNLTSLNSTLINSTTKKNTTTISKPDNSSEFIGNVVDNSSGQYYPFKVVNGNEVGRLSRCTSSPPFAVRECGVVPKKGLYFNVEYKGIDTLKIDEISFVIVNMSFSCDPKVVATSYEFTPLALGNYEQIDPIVKGHYVSFYVKGCDIKMGNTYTAKFKLTYSLLNSTVQTSIFGNVIGRPEDGYFIG